MNKSNTFKISESTVILWTTEREDWDTYHAIFKCMGQNGFAISREARVKKQYKCISKYHHHARKRDLQAVLQIYPAGMKIEFFQGIVFENPNGGQYDFNRVKKMPYLIRKSFEGAVMKIQAMLEARGFECINDPVPADEFERAKNTYFHLRETVPAYEKDGDGVQLSNGLVRWARTRDGRLFRGVIFYDANSNWNVVANSRLRRMFTSRELFSYSSGEIVRKQHPSRVSRLESELKKAVKAQDYERAIVLRDVLKRDQVQNG